jgi:hypothetical protein
VIKLTFKMFFEGEGEDEGNGKGEGEVKTEG